jgi:transposase
LLKNAPKAMTGIHLNVDERWEIICLARQGCSNATIMKSTGHGKGAVRRWAEEAGKKRADADDRPRSGRPRKFSAAHERWIRRACKPSAHAGDVARRFTKAHGLGITRQTVVKIWGSGRRPIIRTKIKGQKRLREPTKIERLEFCRTQHPSSHLPWAFLDGKFCTHWVGVDKKPHNVWWREGDPEPECNGHLVARLFVYAVVGLGLKSNLVFTSPSPKKGSGEAVSRESFTGAHYVRVMKKLKPFLDEWRPSGDYVVIRDRATQHTSDLAMTALEQLGIPVLESFPAQSPDLNPIERVWAQLSRELEGKRPTTPDGYRKQVLAAWKRIDQKTIDGIVGELPGRQLEVVEREGAWLKR